MEKVSPLTRRTGRAVGFRLIGSLADVALSVILGIVLARILPPAEFGLFGMTLSIVTIAQLLGSCGMLDALVQRQNLTPGHEAVAVLFQLGSAMLLSSLLIWGAPLIAELFEMSALAMIIRLQAGVLLLQALALLPESRLTRALAFERLTAIQVATRALGGVITIIFAVRGLGAMALAIGSLTAAGARTLLLWGCAPGLISLQFQRQHFRDLIHYGSGILFISVANILAQRVDVLIIGREVGVDAVGLYQRASQLVLLPLWQIMSAVNKVLFVAMSSVQVEGARFMRGYLGAVRFAALVAFPLLTGLWVIADIIIPLLYGPMWVGTVPILQILTISGIFRILLNINGLVIKARGRVMAEALEQGIWLVLIVIFGFLGSRNGVLGVTLGVVLATWIFGARLTRLALSISGVRFLDWLKAMRTGILGCMVMGLSSLVVKNLFTDSFPRLPLLAVILCTSFLTYITTVRFCLTRDDAALLESACDILPSWPKRLARSILLPRGLNKLRGV